MLMTPKQLAELLGVTPQCVTAWCRAGYMIGDAELLNGRWVIRWSDLMMSSLPVVGNKLRTNGKVEQSCCRVSSWVSCVPGTSWVRVIANLFRWQATRAQRCW